METTMIHKGSWQLCLLILYICCPRSTFSLNCDKQFSYYEFYGLNGFNVTCNDITSGHEHILEEITIMNEVSLTITDSILENVKPSIFKNVYNIKDLNIINSVFKFDPGISIFNPLSKLETLAIENTKFTVKNTTLRGLTRLRSLKMTNNTLSKIEENGFHDLSDLDTLEITNNLVKKLEDLQLCQIKTLKILNVSNNLLSDLGKFIFFCKRALNNGILIPKVDQATFYNLSNYFYDLNEVDLSHNQILELGMTLDGLISLTLLNLGFNKLKRIQFSNLKSLNNLEKLIFSNNYITDVDPKIFLNKTKLYHLDLSHNFLHNITVLNLPKLQYLNLSSNNLTQVLFKKLPELKIVDLSHNNLGNLGLSMIDEVPNIETLNLSFNRMALSSVSFDIFLNVVFLSLQNNFLSSLPENIFFRLKRLKSLDLSRNNLTVLNENVFISLQRLEVLNLSSNSLQELPYSVVQSLKNLRSLDLSNNKLKYLPYDLIISKLPNIRNMNIKNNLLTCDLLSKVINFLKEKHVRYTSNDNFDMEKISQNIAGVPCILNQSLLANRESNYSKGSVLLNLGLGVLIIFLSVAIFIVGYKFYIFLKRRRYRADEFELIN